MGLKSLVTSETVNGILDGISAGARQAKPVFEAYIAGCNLLIKVSESKALRVSITLALQNIASIIDSELTDVLTKHEHDFDEELSIFNSKLNDVENRPE